jgi:leader peptidase (prepilin peptidase)/N-methyltransferase
MIYAEPGRLSEQPLWPNVSLLLGGIATVGVMSALTLPWPAAIASTVLAALMIAGADIDARTYLLPDAVTLGAMVSGIVAAVLLNTQEPVYELWVTIIRATGTAFGLALLRGLYAHIRGCEGLGLGDVKLSAAVGAWLPVEFIALCFSLAATGALIAVLVSRFRGHPISRNAKVPFGAFLCPSLWFVFYMYLLQG